MIKIVVNDEQAQLISQSRELIEILDQQGNHLGYFHHAWSQREIELALKRRKHREPWLTTDDVLARLPSNEE